MSLVFSAKKKYLQNFFSSAGNTIISMLTQITLIPIGINCLGTEKFGLWLLIGSAVNYFSVFNFGIHSAALYMVMGHGLCKKSMEIAKNIFKLLLIICSIVISILVALWFLCPKIILSILSIPAVYVNEGLVSFFILSISFLLNLPFSSLSAYLGGTQNQHKENIFLGLNQICIFFAFVIPTLLGHGLVISAFSVGVSTLFVSLIKLLVVFKINSKVDSSDCEHQPLPTEREIFSKGFSFFIMSITALLLWNTDQPLISKFLDLSSVASYSLTAKLYLVCVSILTIVNSSLYPVIGNYINNCNWEWVNKSIKNLSMVTYLLSVYVLIGGVFFLEPIFNLWTGGKGYPGIWVAFFWGMYMVLYPIVNLNTAILSILQKLKFVPIILLLEAILKIIISYLFLNFFGCIEGVVVATLIATLFFSYFMLPVLVQIRSENQISLKVSDLFVKIFIAFTVGLISVFIVKWGSEIWLRCFSFIFVSVVFTVIYIWTYGKDSFFEVMRQFKIRGVS